VSKKLSKREIEEIKNNAIQMIDNNEDGLFFSIGVEIVYKKLPKGAKASAPYREIGEDAFYRALKKIQRLLCKNGKLKGEYSVDSVAGIIITALIGDFTSGTVSVMLALFYKLGLKAFCAYRI
jgi:hypothetical protein